MDFGGSNGSEDGAYGGKVVNDEDLLFDNFYKKAGQTPALSTDLTAGMVMMPPTPTTLPK